MLAGMASDSGRAASREEAGPAGRRSGGRSRRPGAARPGRGGRAVVGRRGRSRPSTGSGRAGATRSATTRAPRTAGPAVGGQRPVARAGRFSLERPRPSRDFGAAPGPGRGGSGPPARGRASAAGRAVPDRRPGLGGQADRAYRRAAGTGQPGRGGSQSAAVIATTGRVRAVGRLSPGAASGGGDHGEGRGDRPWTGAGSSPRRPDEGGFTRPETSAGPQWGRSVDRSSGGLPASSSARPRPRPGGSEQGWAPGPPRPGGGARGASRYEARDDGRQPAGPRGAAPSPRAGGAMTGSGTGPRPTGADWAARPERRAPPRQRLPSPGREDDRGRRRSRTASLPGRRLAVAATGTAPSPRGPVRALPGRTPVASRGPRPTGGDRPAPPTAALGPPTEPLGGRAAAATGRGERSSAGQSYGDRTVVARPGRTAVARGQTGAARGW